MGAAAKVNQAAGGKGGGEVSKKSPESEGIFGFPVPGRGWLAPSCPSDSLGMERLNKRSQRRRLRVCCLVAGKGKWKSWLTCQPSSRTGEPPLPNDKGERGDCRHHSKSGSRLDPAGCGEWIGARLALPRRSVIPTSARFRNRRARGPVDCHAVAEGGILCEDCTPTEAR
jgi:hypothetical protein